MAGCFDSYNLLKMGFKIAYIVFLYIISFYMLDQVQNPQGRFPDQTNILMYVCVTYNFVNAVGSISINFTPGAFDDSDKKVIDEGDVCCCHFFSKLMRYRWILTLMFLGLPANVWHSYVVEKVLHKIAEECSYLIGFSTFAVFEICLSWTIFLLDLACIHPIKGYRKRLMARLRNRSNEPAISPALYQELLRIELERERARHAPLFEGLEDDPSEPVAESNQ